MHGYFRTLCVGYGIYAIANTIVLILLYFTDYYGALLSSALFALTASAATVVSLFFPKVYFGFGFLVGSGVFFLCALLRLNEYTKRLPYYILSVQPIVAEDKERMFTRLEYFLERKMRRMETYEEKKDR